MLLRLVIVALLLLSPCLRAAEPDAESSPDPEQKIENGKSESKGGLKLKLAGVNGAIADNIRAHLSPLPATPRERASFLFSFEDAAQDALQSLGYYQASISHTLNRDKKDWVLELTVSPGEPMRLKEVIVMVSGEAQEDRAFRRELDRLPLKPGDILHHGHYETIKSTLVSLGLVRGYFQGQLLQHRLEVDREHNSANLILLYDSGPRYRLGEVNFWASELNPDLLEKLVPFEPGTPYESDQIAELTNGLLGSGYFQTVKVLPHPEEAVDGLVPVEVGITPPPRHSFEVGLGYATDTEGRISLVWRTPVINRYGHSQETKAEIAKLNPRLGFEYRIPLKHPIKDQLLFRASVGKEEFGDIDSTQYQTSISRKTTTQSGWIRTTFIRYLRENWDQAELSPQAAYVLPGITFARTRRAGPQLDPRRGFRQQYRFEFGDPALLSEQRILRLRAQFRMVNSPLPRHRISSRLDLGMNMINDDKLLELAPSLRFFAGGDQSIRGFAYQTLGPKIDLENDDGTLSTINIGGRYLMVGSVEYQYYLTDSWRVAAFVDSGNAFDVYDSDAFEIVTSVGGGVHWISPIGPVRFDVGYGISESSPPWRLHITIGAEL